MHSVELIAGAVSSWHPASDSKTEIGPISVPEKMHIVMFVTEKCNAILCLEQMHCQEEQSRFSFSIINRTKLASSKSNPCATA